MKTCRSRMNCLGTPPATTSSLKSIVNQLLLIVTVINRIRHPSQLLDGPNRLRWTPNSGRRHYDPCSRLDLQHHLPKKKRTRNQTHHRYHQTYNRLRCIHQSRGQLVEPCIGSSHRHLYSKLRFCLLLSRLPRNTRATQTIIHF